jgi:hypothetical protein
MSDDNKVFVDHVERIWWYTHFLAQTTGQQYIFELTQTLNENIRLIRECIRELIDRFDILANQKRELKRMLDFDQLSVSMQIIRLTDCVVQLGIYANLSFELSQSFFYDDDSRLTEEELEFKYGFWK